MISVSVPTRSDSALSHAAALGQNLGVGRQQQTGHFHWCAPDRARASSNAAAAPQPSGFLFLLALRLPAGPETELAAASFEQKLRGEGGLAFRFPLSLSGMILDEHERRGISNEGTQSAEEPTRNREQQVANPAAAHLP